MNVIDYEIGSTTGGNIPDLQENSGGGRTRITVVYTTIEGTLAALEAALPLSKGLNASVTLLIAEEMPSYFPLGDAPVVREVLERLCHAIFQELNLAEDAVGLMICFCHRQSECLRAELEPNSLVVLGERRRHRWLHRERRLEHMLRDYGHDPLVIPAAADNQHAEAIVQRLLEESAAPTPA
jgi:hypothetical protein